MDTSEASVPAVDATGAAGQKENQSLSKGTLVGSVIAGIAASTCCIGPLILLTLGISGSWIGNLSAMEAFRPYFMGITLILLGLAFRKLYLVPRACVVDAPCSTPSNLRKQRITFWIVSVFVLIVMSFPWYGPYLLD